MKRRDAIRRTLGITGVLSAIPLSGQVRSEDDAELSGSEGATVSGSDPETEPLDGADIPNTALDQATAVHGDIEPSDSPALDGDAGGGRGDGGLEELTEQLRGTHEERCQCPVCGGSMPGRG